MDFTKEGLSYHYLIMIDYLVIDLSFAENRVKVLVAQSCPTFCDPIDCCPTDSSVHGILLVRTGVGCPSLLQGISVPEMEPGSPALQADSLPSEPTGKPQNRVSRYYVLSEVL